MKKTAVTILWVAFLITANLGFAFDLQDPPDHAPWYLDFANKLIDHFPQVDAWFGAFMVFAMSILRALAELLSFIASKTESKTHGQIAQALCKIARWVAAIVGWFGLGAPKK